VPVSVPAGGVGVADFGDQQQGTISGVVFNDANGNGVQDPTEPGLGGVTVQLINPTTQIAYTIVKELVNHLLDNFNLITSAIKSGCVFYSISFICQELFSSNSTTAKLNYSPPPTSQQPQPSSQAAHSILFLRIVNKFFQLIFNTSKSAKNTSKNH